MKLPRLALNSFCNSSLAWKWQSSCFSLPRSWNYRPELHTYFMNSVDGRKLKREEDEVMRIPLTVTASSVIVSDLFS